MKPRSGFLGSFSTYFLLVQNVYISQQPPFSRIYSWALYTHSSTMFNFNLTPGCQLSLPTTAHASYPNTAFPGPAESRPFLHCVALVGLVLASCLTGRQVLETLTIFTGVLLVQKEDGLEMEVHRLCYLGKKLREVIFSVLHNLLTVIFFNIHRYSNLEAQKNTLNGVLCSRKGFRQTINIFDI